jgi:TonB family protein
MENPSYPDGARRKGISGSVVISAIVRPDGKIGEPRIVGKAYGELDAAALAITHTWLFEPAKTSDGIPVPVRASFTVNFAVYN